MIYDIKSKLFQRFLISSITLKKDVMRDILNSIALKGDFNQQKPTGQATSA